MQKEQGINRFKSVKKNSFFEKIKQKWLSFKKINKQNQRKAQAAVQLFDFSKDCPDNIINCYELRDRFKVELEKLQQTKICSLCNVNLIKQMLFAAAVFQDDL